MSTTELIRYHLEKAIELQPDYGEPHYYLALQLQKIENIDGAHAHLQNAVKLCQLSADKYAHEADINRQRNQFARARRNLTKALEQRALAAQAHYLLGLLALDSGNGTEATSHFSAAVKVDPGQYEAIYQMGMIVLQRGSDDQARELFEKAVDVEPYHAKSHIQLAYIIAVTDEVELARNHYLIALDIEPDLQDTELESQLGLGN